MSMLSVLLVSCMVGNWDFVAALEPPVVASVGASDWEILAISPEEKRIHELEDKILELESKIKTVSIPHPKIQYETQPVIQEQRTYTRYCTPSGKCYYYVR